MTDAIQTPRTATRLGILLAAVLLCLMTCFGVSSAQAHDELVTSTPQSGEVLKNSPKSLVLTFSGDIQKIGTILELNAANGQKVGTTFKIDRRDVTVTPESPLPNGSYMLVARVISSDGHEIVKDIDFEVNDPAALVTSAPATAVAPDGTPPAAGPAPATDPAATAEDSTDNRPLAGMPAGLTWSILALAALGMIVMVLLKVRRQDK